jgi:hypothetical protein
MDVLHVVAVDLGDVHETEPAVFELEERPVGGDALNGAVDHGPNFDLCDLMLLSTGARPTVGRPGSSRSGGSRCHAPKPHVKSVDGHRTISP